jgi:hypothetical protein
MIFDIAKIFEVQIPRHFVFARQPFTRAAGRRAQSAAQPSHSLLFTYFCGGWALFLAFKKLLNDRIAEDHAAELQEQQQQQQQQPRQLGYSSDNQKISSCSTRHESELERDRREFQEFKRFQEQKRLHEQPQAAGGSA